MGSECTNFTKLPQWVIDVWSKDLWDRVKRAEKQEEDFKRMAERIALKREIHQITHLIEKAFEGDRNWYYSKGKDN